MAEKDRVSDLNKRLGGRKNKQNVSTLDKNMRAIERLINAAAEEDAGLISVYRALDANEKRELAKTEPDEIANAYHVELSGDDKTYYITYKPRVEKGKAGAGKLEHLNRSTPFVQNLLDKIDNEYSFLYCHSKSRISTVPDPHAAKGFVIERGITERLEGKNKYELFFLVECRDNIDASERITNIIDSVLLDVDGTSGDFFSRMSYASLEHDAESDDEEVPEIDFAVQNQLNNIITEIRDDAGVRQRILDFIIDSPTSELHAHMKARNDAYLSASYAAPDELNALSSTVTCRMMPIGVFLNEIDNDCIHYYIVGKNGERAELRTEVNPASPFCEHVCPHCGKPYSAANGAVAVKADGGYEAGCEECAKRCTHRGCTSYSFVSSGCKVCGKILCPEHSYVSVDSHDRLCSECARVFRDGASGKPLSPADAAVRGHGENYVAETVALLGKTGALNQFKQEKLLRKSRCVKCKTADGYKYYLPNECRKCSKCGESYYKDDVKKTTDGGELLCVFDRIDCSCGNVVAKEKAHVCAHDGCNVGFCGACANKAHMPKNYRAAVKIMHGKIKAVKSGENIYCSEHIAVCKVCGKPVAKDKAKVCPSCGGTYCPECEISNKCRTCGIAETVDAKNYKKVSGKTRLARLNALPFYERFSKTAVLEDNENIVFVTVRGGKNGNKIIIYNKLTGKSSGEKSSLGSKIRGVAESVLDVFKGDK